MRTITRMTLISSAFAGGVLIIGAASAQAAEQDTDGTDSLLGGTQSLVPVELEVDLEDNAISVLGDSSSVQEESAEPTSTTSTTTQETSGESSTAGGTQTSTPVDIPVEVENNAISVLGDSEVQTPASTEESVSPPAEEPQQETSGSDSTLGGTQASAPVDVPVEVEGNAISVLGDAGTATSTEPDIASSGEETQQQTSGEDGTASGTQVQAPVQIPVTIENNSISLVGESSTETGSDQPASVAGESEQSTEGADSLLSGTQASAPVQAPLSVSGNSISLLGDADVQSGDPVSSSSASGNEQSTTGEEATLSGTQVQAPVQAPVMVENNAISVLGDTSSSGAVTSSETTGPEEVVTGGQEGLLSGSQVAAPVMAPVSVTGNGISLLGDARTIAPQGTLNSSPSSQPSTTGADGILSGSQTVLPVSVPLDLTGNAISVAGDVSTGVTPTAVEPEDPGTEVPGDTTPPPPGAAPGSPGETEGSGDADSGEGSQGATTGEEPTDTSEPGISSTPNVAAVNPGELAQTGSSLASLGLVAILLIASGLFLRRFSLV